MGGDANGFSRRIFREWPISTRCYRSLLNRTIRHKCRTGEEVLFVQVPHEENGMILEIRYRGTKNFSELCWPGAPSFSEAILAYPYAHCKAGHAASMLKIYVWCGQESRTLKTKAVGHSYSLAGGTHIRSSH